MEILGPAITLDTIVEALMIGVGTLSGVQRLEVLSGFAVMSVIVNYVVFMTFYPACLSLTLDLSRNCNGSVPNSPINTTTISNTTSGNVEGEKHRIRDPSLIRALSEEDQKQNPIIQRVKLIMSSGLMIVHFHSRFIGFDSEGDDVDARVNVNPNVPADAKNLNMAQTLNKTESGDFTEYIMRWLSISTEQIFILILLLALCIKFIFFDRDDLTNQIQRDGAKQIEEEERKKREKEEAAALAVIQKPTLILPPSSPPPIPRESSPPPRKLALFSISEEDPITKDSCVQTDLTAFDVFGDSDEDNPEFIESALVPCRPPRSIDECVKIMMSDEGAKSLTGKFCVSMTRLRH